MMTAKWLKFSSILICLCYLTYVNAQVFNTAAIPANDPDKPNLKHRFSSIDTIFWDWDPADAKVIDVDDGILWQKNKDSGFAFFAAAGEHLGMMSVEYKYDQGKASGSSLHFDVLNTEGQELAAAAIDHDKGITAVGMTTDGTDYFLTYQKAINSGDRDLYVAKFSPNADLLWETKIGKRFGTFGPGLIRVNPAGQIVVFAQMYDQVSFDILSKNGEVADRKFMPFIKEFSPASFTYNDQGHIVAIGSSRRYVKRETITSLIVFELDKNYQPIRYREFGSDYTDLGVDIILDGQGGYYFLGNCENLKAPYGQRPNFTVIGHLNEAFKPQKIKRIQNQSTGINLRLAWSAQNGLLFFQRSGESGYGFNLFQLDRDLDIKTIHKVKGRFVNPNNLHVTKNGELYLGGGSSKSWLTKLSLK